MIQGHCLGLLRLSLPVVRPTFDLTTGSLPSGLTLTRASTATVQTGTTAVTTGVAVDVARFGRLLDADTTALIIECARTNLSLSSEAPASAGWFPGSLIVTTYPDGTAPNGSTTTACKHAVTSPGYSRYSQYSATTGIKYSFSMWHQSPSGTFTGRWQTGSATATFSCTTAWARVTGQYTSTGVLFYLTPAISDTQTMRTWGHQVEVGDAPSSYIPTTLGATATRQGERLVATGTLTANGRLDWNVILRPRGSSSEYITDGTTVTCWYVDSNNKASWNSTTRLLTITVAGVTNTCTLAAWSRHDYVRLLISCGVTATVVKQRVNSGSVSSLAITGSALAAINATSMDVLCEGTTKQWWGYVEQIGFEVPAWAA